MSDTTPDTFDRVGRWLGNLDHPYYDDKRQRWVWYEASAVAFQAALIGGNVTAAAVLLVTGQWILVSVLMLPITIASFVMAGWVQRYKAECDITSDDLQTKRGAAGVASVVLYLGALLFSIGTDLADRITADSGFFKGFSQGLTAGAVALLVVAVALAVGSVVLGFVRD